MLMNLDESIFQEYFMLTLESRCLQVLGWGVITLLLKYPANTSSRTQSCSKSSGCPALDHQCIRFKSHSLWGQDIVLWHGEGGGGVSQRPNLLDVMSNCLTLTHLPYFVKLFGSPPKTKYENKMDTLSSFGKLLLIDCFVVVTISHPSNYPMSFSNFRFIHFFVAWHEMAFRRS